MQFTSPSKILQIVGAFWIKAIKQSDVPERYCCLRLGVQKTVSHIFLPLPIKVLLILCSIFCALQGISRIAQFFSNPCFVDSLQRQNSLSFYGFVLWILNNSLFCRLLVGHEKNISFQTAIGWRPSQTESFNENPNAN